LQLARPLKICSFPACKLFAACHALYYFL
jgi:hypothetical protein